MRNKRSGFDSRYRCYDFRDCLSPHPSRDMAEISLKRRRSSKQPTNQTACLYIASALIRVLGLIHLVWNNENCHILANILQIWMIPHIHTLFELISIPYENQHQALNIKKINRGQIAFREYWITLLKPMTVIFSYKLRNVTYKTNAYCSQRSGIGPLGLLLNIFLSHLFFWFSPLLKLFVTWK